MLTSTQNRAACSNDGNLIVSLADGVLTDDQGRTGYIASNFQFQFDSPPQSGALYTAGFSQCANGSLALGATTVFWQCASGTFFNLYDRWSAYQCAPVHILVMPCQGTQSADAGETVVGTEVVTTTVVVSLGDGQSQVVTTTTLLYVCQIGDGAFFSVSRCFVFRPILFFSFQKLAQLTLPSLQAKSKATRPPAPAPLPRPR